MRLERMTLMTGLAAIVLTAPSPSLANTVASTEAQQEASWRCIRGHVVDVDGAALPGARVRLLSTGGDTLAETESKADGDFAFATRAVGPATIEVTLQGFRTFVAAAPQDDPPGAVRVVLVLAGVSEEVAVTATRSELPLFETPQSTSVVTAGDMHEQAAATIPAALEGVAGVYMQRTTFGGGSPIIRGLVGNQVLLMVDGIRLNNSTYRLGPNQYLNTVDSLGASRVEVVRGPTSSLYGSDGLGGVVNVLSEGFPMRPGISGRFAFGLDTAASAPVASLRFRGREGRVGFVGGATAASFDDLTGGALTGVQLPTAYDRRAADLKVAVDLGRAGELRGGGQYFRDDDVPRYDRIASGRNDIYLFDPQKRTLGYLRYQARFAALGDVELSATLSRMRQTEGRWLRSAGSTTDRLEVDAVTTYGLGVQLTWPEYLRQQWTAGVEVYDDIVASERIDRAASGAERQRRGRFPDGAGYRSTAVYLQSRVRVASRVDLLLGARYSRFSASAFLEGFGGDYAATFDDLTGSAFAVLYLDPRWQLSGGIAKGFRAPGLDDATVFGDFNAGIEIPNPDLRPERLINYEATVKALYPTLWLSATVFDSHLNDLIARAPGTFNGSSTFESEEVFQRQNIDDAEIYGTELDIRFWPLDRLELAGTLAAVHGTNETTGDPLRRIPPLFGRIEGKWRFAWSNAWIGALVDYATKQDRLAPGDVSDTRIPEGGTSGYGVGSLNGGFTLSRRWQVNAILHNIGNVDYRVHGSGINGPGRSLRMFLRAEFGR